jgi:hypothetical protein
MKENSNLRRSWKKLEEARNTLAGGMTETKLSKEEAKQRFIEDIAELEFAVEWQVKSIGDGKDGMGDLIDLPICREEVQPRRLHTKSQLLEPPLFFNLSQFSF